MNPFKREPYPYFKQQTELLVEVLQLPKEIIQHEIMPFLHETCDCCKEFLLKRHACVLKNSCLVVCACCHLLITEYGY